MPWTKTDPLKLADDILAGTPLDEETALAILGLVPEPGEIRAALDRSVAAEKPALINVEIRQDREYKGGIYV